jgi:hypothetical protein
MAEPAPRVESIPVPARGRAFPSYMAGIATWFGGFGMQRVLFSWLVVGELQAEARWVGVAQSASMIPNFLLLLHGGALADCLDRRALLIRLHLLASTLAVGLVPAVASGARSLPLLIGYALCIPARAGAGTSGSGERGQRGHRRRPLRARPGGVERRRVAAVAGKMRGPMGVPVADRRHLLSVYPRCFVGSEGVDWLVEHAGWRSRPRRPSSAR